MWLPLQVAKQGGTTLLVLLNAVRGAPKESATDTMGRVTRAETTGKETAVKVGTAEIAQGRERGLTVEACSAVRFVMLVPTVEYPESCVYAKKKKKKHTYSRLRF